MSELFTKLGIDWKILLAQVINFGILLIVLYRLLYKPILAVLEKRQKKIEESIKLAKQIEAEAEEAKAKREAEIKRAEEEAQKIIKEAQSTALAVQNKIKTEAQCQARDLITQAKQEIDLAKKKIIKEVRQDVVDLVMRTTDKVLERKKPEVDEREMIEDVLKDL